MGNIPRRVFGLFINIDIKFKQVYGLHSENIVRYLSYSSSALRVFYPIKSKKLLYDFLVIVLQNIHQSAS